MATAHKRGAAVNDKFYFRKNVFPSKYWRIGGFERKDIGWPNGYLLDLDGTTTESDDEYELMTMNEIINGQVC